MIWILYAFLSAVFSTVSTIFRKRTLIKEHSITFLATNKIFQLIIVCVLLPFINFKLALSVYALIAVIAVLGVEGDIFWTKALKRLNISIASPLTNISPAIVVILAYFILNEKITILQIIGIIFIVLGAYVLEADHKFSDFKRVYEHLKNSKYSIMLFFSLIIGAFSSIGERYVLGNNFLKPITMLFFVYLFTTVLIVSIQVLDDRKLKKIKRTMKRAKLPIFITAVSGLLTTAFYYLAIKDAYISLVMPILLTSTLLTTVLGGQFFKEGNLLYKSISCIIMLIGVALVIGSSI
ncbi:MAG: DMT family transporter [Nanoarchaeota archaeon]|nr:DMT family transporter [Nanoarchaeota archaeon]MBU0962655.1 DMT family transporter [Nanoarchaeota archaeon]